MQASLPVATVRLDVGVVDVTARRLLRVHGQRIAVEPETTPDVALAHTLRSSSLLRPGRAVTTRVLLETPQVVYGAVDSGGRSHRPNATVPTALRDGLIRAVARRRVRGPATLELAPLARAQEARDSFGDLEHNGLGVIVDRSNAAVSILVVGLSGLVWARSVPADDPGLAARLLIDRARGLLGSRVELRWWRLHDVASDEDERTASRAAREFSAAAAAELDGVPMLQVVGG